MLTAGKLYLGIRTLSGQNVGPSTIPDVAKLVREGHKLPALQDILHQHKRSLHVSKAAGSSRMLSSALPALACALTAH